MEPIACDCCGLHVTRQAPCGHWFCQICWEFRNHHNPCTICAKRRNP